MKKLLLALSLLAVVGTANAQWHHGGHHGGGYYRGGCYGCGWIAPAIIGGVIGYEINRANQPVIVQQPPVYVQQPQPYIQTPPAGYHWQQMIDPQTNTTKIVLVPN
jgi:hypothetical protein